MSKNDGGPAFPSVGEGFGNPNYSAPGMTLRDYFAGQAMSAMLSRPGIHSEEGADGFAAVAYKFADAMLREREASEHDD